MKNKLYFTVENSDGETIVYQIERRGRFKDLKTAKETLNDGVYVDPTKIKENIESKESKECFC